MSLSKKNQAATAGALRDGSQDTMKKANYVAAFNVGSIGRRPLYKPQQLLRKRQRPFTSPFV